MTKYLLDTSLIAGYLLAREKAIQLVHPLIEKDQAVTSILVYGELQSMSKSLQLLQRTERG